MRLAACILCSLTLPSVFAEILHTYADQLPLFVGNARLESSPESASSLRIEFPRTHFLMKHLTEVKALRPLCHSVSPPQAAAPDDDPDLPVVLNFPVPLPRAEAPAFLPE